MSHFCWVDDVNSKLKKLQFKYEIKFDLYYRGAYIAQQMKKKLKNLKCRRLGFYNNKNLKTKVFFEPIFYSSQRPTWR